jgi:DNA polymerase I-like protein with 3'-5' exonuclease and polymerase domains
LQNLQWAFHDWNKKIPAASVIKDYVLPDWWLEQEVSPEQREVEIIEDVPAPPYKYITKQEELLEMLEDLVLDGNLAFDIETYYPQARVTKEGTRMMQAVKVITNRYRSKIRLLQFYRDGAEFVWLVDLMKLGPGFADSVACECLREIFKHKTIIGHNIVCFDLPWIWEHLKIRTNSILDTYVAHRIITNGIWDMANDLKTCFLDIDLRLPKDSGSSDWGISQLSQRQISYAAHDVRWMHDLMRKYEEIIDDPDYSLRTTWNLESALCPIVVDLTNHGNPVNLERLPIIQADAEERLSAAEKAAKDFLEAPDLNLQAHAKLLKALQKKGYKAHSTQEKAMSLEGSEGARLVINYRHIRNRELKFLKIVEEAVRQDGRVHSIYDQLGTLTGRFSSRDPNSQNFPRPDKKKKDSSVRSLFQAPFGYKLNIADFSQMELVIAACVVNEPNMLAALHAKEDLHKKFAGFVKGVPADTIDDLGRNLGKSANFGLLYGQSACGGAADFPNGGLRGFARNKYGVIMTEEEAIQCRELWFEMFPGFKDYHSEGWNEARRILEDGKGSVRTKGIGRVQYFLEVRDNDDNLIRPLLLHSVFSSLVNTPVQGTSAEIFKLVMIHLTEELPQAEIVNVVHDEIVLLAREIDAEYVKQEVERIMVDSTHEIFPDAPMRAEVSIVDNWAEK